MAIDLWRGLAEVIAQSTIGSNKAISRSRTLIIRFLKLITQHFRTHLLNVVIFKSKSPRRMHLRGLLSGATGNRTRDTRIFSPLLYQLSYGTVFVWDCKGRHFFFSCKLFLDFFILFLKIIQFSEIIQ